MIDPQLFTRKTDEVFLRAKNFTARTLDTFVDDVQKAKVEEDDETEVYELFGCTLLKGVISELMQYFPADEIRNTLADLGNPIYDAAPYYEGVKKNPSKRIKENRESSILAAAKEALCILLDWEVTPEDLDYGVIIDDLDCICSFRNKNTGEKYVYSLKDDCIL